MNQTNNSSIRNEIFQIDYNDLSNIDFVNSIIDEAIESNASDIHFEVYENRFRIRYRIDGHLCEKLSLPLSKNASVISRLKIMSNLDISEKRRPQDGKIKYNYKSADVDIRVSSIPTNYGEKAVLRILNKLQLNLDLRALGMEEHYLEIVNKNIYSPYGMILITGPTGSGKTTSLYAILKKINNIDKNILTIEDPIEYNLEGINQSNVKPDIGYNFAAALRAYLRQDPDIIMVGEIRDKETAEIAIRSALTGHLVLSTLHTNDSISSITRLQEMGVEPYLIAAALRMIIAQRLVRMICSCSKAGVTITDNNEKMTTKSAGCKDCNYTGYKGRTALYEILEINEEIKEAIINNNISEISIIAAKQNFLSLREYGIMLIKKGITTYDEVIRETN